MDDNTPPRSDLETTDTTFDEFGKTATETTPTHPLAYELVGLQRVVNSIRLYGIGHDRSWRQSQDLLTRIKPMLDELRSVPLQVTDGALLFNETKVIEEGDRGGIVDELFRDGIRVLTLASGIEVDEFLELLSILGTNFHLPQHQEDTLQGLLWAADLPHVSYEAVQGIEEAVEDSADAGRGEHVDFDALCKALAGITPNPQGMPSLSSAQPPDLDRLSGSTDEDGATLLPTQPDLPQWQGDGASIHELLSAGLTGAEDDDSLEPEDVDEEVDLGLEGEDGDAGAPSGVGDQPAEGHSAGQNTHYGGQGDQPEHSTMDTIDFVDGRANELSAPPDDILQLWEEAESENETTLLDRCISILIHTALFEAPGADLLHFAPLIEAAMRHAASRGMAARYRSTIEMLAGIVEAEEGLGDADAAQRLLRNLLDIDLLMQYAAAADPDDAGAARDIQRVIEVGGARMTQAILDRIPHVEDEYFRRFLIQRVVLSMGGDPRPLTKDLRKLEPAQMRIRLELIARMDSYIARDMLTSLLEHPEAHVRIAAIELIPSGHLRHVWKRLAQRLADDDDSVVRAAIIHRMEGDRLPALAPLLQRMSTAESFHRRSVEEKTLVLTVLARTGGTAGVRTLIQLMNAKASLIHPRLVETRRLAAASLGQTGHPTASAALQKASKSWDPGIRRAATEALAGGRRK